MNFKGIAEITDIQVIAVGAAIREVRRLRKAYGPGRWRKLKGLTLVELANGRLYLAEVHWYEAHGIGRKEMKLKYLLEEHS